MDARRKVHGAIALPSSGIKCDLHIHTCEDPVDKGITYSSYDIINLAKRNGFNCIAITCHNKVVYNETMNEIAGDMLLIPGCEMTIEKAHVLVYNITEEERKSITTFEGLRKWKKSRKNVMVIVPHMCFPVASGLGVERFEKYHDIFDAVEIAQFYKGPIDYNKKAIALAKKYNKPLVANSDAHSLRFFGAPHSLIEGKHLERYEVIKHIRDGKVKPVTRPSTYKEAYHVGKRIVWCWLLGKLGCSCDGPF